MKFKLDEFSQSKEVEWNFHVDESDASKRSLGYGIIMGLDLMRELGLIIKKEETRKEIESTKTMVLRLNRILENKTQQKDNTDLLVKGSDLQLKDRVRVVNPSVGQQNEGEIIGGETA